jgi:hypothetical protein
MIRSLLLLVVWLILRGVAVAEPSLQIEPLGLSDLDSYFDEIHEPNSGLVFRRCADSGPMFCQVGTKPPFISQPGTVLAVNYGSRMVLRNKAAEIKFFTSPELADKGMHGASFLVIETKLRRGTDRQVIHVGLATVPYFTHQMPSERRLVIWPWPSIRTVADLEKAEKDYAGIDPKAGNQP